MACLAWQMAYIKIGPRPEHVPRFLVLNPKEFHWLRHRMGEMLATFDGSRAVDEPAKFPKWLSMDGRPRFSAFARSASAVPKASLARQAVPKASLARSAVPKASKQQQQSSVDANIDRLLHQFQLLSQQIQQREQQTDVPMPIVPDFARLLHQFQLLSQQIQQPQEQNDVPMPIVPDFTDQFVQQMDEEDQLDTISSQDWTNMAISLAQTLQTQMRQVPAGESQPMTQENAPMHPASQIVPMPREYRTNNPNMDMASLAQQQKQRNCRDDLSGWDEDGEEGDQRENND